LVYSSTIGKNYEYRIRNWFRDLGWESERNPLSGASEQIVRNMGKHDVRVRKNDIFLQLECKKTNKKNGILNIEKEWIDKINFNNDEFLIFSYKNCLQHFCLFPEKSVIEKIQKSELKIVEDTIKVSGKKQFGMKREIIEKNKGKVFRVLFDDIIYLILDLEEYIGLREKFGPTQNQTFCNKISLMNNIDQLKEIYNKEKDNLTTTEHKEYYIKLEKLEKLHVTCLHIKKFKTTSANRNSRRKI
jgi:Holliday junction resolvase